LETAAIAPEQIDLPVCATSRDTPIPDRRVGAAQLGITAPAFDVNAACAGFVRALDRDGVHRVGQAETVVVMGARSSRA
jgi:3-oxoacyl-[acyl-carrier-protein] synthase III